MGLVFAQAVTAPIYHVSPFQLNLSEAKKESLRHCQSFPKQKLAKSKSLEGALDRARTDDLRLIRATRYQLRYESCCSDVHSQRITYHISNQQVEHLTKSTEHHTGMMKLFAVL